MDVKAPLNQESYSNCCGVSVDLEKIKGSIDLLRKTFISYEFRVTAVPTLLKKENLLTLANELKGSEKLTLQNFNPEHPLDPGLKNIKPYTDQGIEEMQEEMNQILKGSNKSEGSAFFYSKPATRNL
jgi:pyruvate-formate lyase-activating enzyme